MKIKRDYRERNGLVLECIHPIAQLCRRLLYVPTPYTAELLTENRRLRETIKRKDVERTEHYNTVVGFERIRIQLEEKIATLTCELLHATDGPSVLPPIPVNPQGKDAMYWHQACRTLQQHNSVLKKELERLRSASQGMENSQDTRLSAIGSSI